MYRKSQIFVDQVLNWNGQHVPCVSSNNVFCGENKKKWLGIIFMKQQSWRTPTLTLEEFWPLIAAGRRHKRGSDRNPVLIPATASETGFHGGDADITWTQLRQSVFRLNTRLIFSRVIQVQTGLLITTVALRAPKKCNKYRKHLVSFAVRCQNPPTFCYFPPHSSQFLCSCTQKGLVRFRFTRTHFVWFFHCNLSFVDKSVST